MLKKCVPLTIILLSHVYDKCDQKKTLNIHLILFAQIINAAAHQDREGVLQKSREMKFLTGYESKVQSCHSPHICHI